MTPRRLTFAVGTSLLTVSLATSVVGCKKATANPGPEQPPHVNEGPTPEEPAEPTEIVNTVPSEPSPE
jgi:hypothetical protein